MSDMPQILTQSSQDKQLQRQLSSITNITTKPPHITHKQATILKTKAEHPDLTVREIAGVSKCDHSLVVRTLKKYGIKQKEVEHFKRCRADIYAGTQARLLAACTDEAIQKAPVGSVVLAAMQLNTNERLERGLSSANVSVQIGLSGALQESVNKIVSRIP